MGDKEGANGARTDDKDQRGGGGGRQHRLVRRVKVRVAIRFGEASIQNMSGMESRYGVPLYHKQVACTPHWLPLHVRDLQLRSLVLSSTRI